MMIDEDIFKHGQAVIVVSELEEGGYAVSVWSGVETGDPYTEVWAVHTREFLPRHLPRTPTEYGTPSKLAREHTLSNRKRAIDHAKRLAQSLVASGFVPEAEVMEDFEPVATYVPTTPFNVKKAR